MVQEFLNRSDEHLWGFVSNGRLLRILRDNRSLTRQAYVEIDLEAIFQGELYPDFTVLWMLCHQSRVEAERPEECWLERWSGLGWEQGARALETLRKGVQEAIEHLGRGFLSHRSNGKLRERLRSGALSTQEFYREILRLVYRLLFLFVAEDRDALQPRDVPVAARETYRDFYSTHRLRLLAEELRGTAHADLFVSLRMVMLLLGTLGAPELGLPVLGSYLWSDETLPDLMGSDLSNADLLEAVRALGFTRRGNDLWRVDYRNLGSEELGSVYESLLELHPEVDAEAGHFSLSVAAGHERKTTGSYYTPHALVQSLLETALDPVLEEAAKGPNPEAAILSLTVCDPATGSGHFLIAAAHRIARRLASVRTGDEEPAPLRRGREPHGRGALQGEPLDGSPGAGQAAVVPGCPHPVREQPPGHHAGSHGQGHSGGGVWRSDRGRQERSHATPEAEPRGASRPAEPQGRDRGPVGRGTPDLRKPPGPWRG
jgi:hypothetical protein